MWWLEETLNTNTNKPSTTSIKDIKTLDFVLWQTREGKE
jgi:hypothetical protein